METVRALVVCTGNTCRSPLGGAMLARALREASIAAHVASAGTLGWSERPATPKAVAVAAERGLDISAHTSRRLEPSQLDVDLVVAMTRDHAGAVIARDPDLEMCVFLPSEFARLACRTDGREETETVSDYITRIGSGRPGGPVGRAAEEIPDPAGEPLGTYRRVADRLERELTAFVAALDGRRIRR